MSSKDNSQKKRYWTFILYPDSLPENWLDILQETGLEIAVSPLHDSDINPSGVEGELKKPHYHVVVCYNGPTTFNVVKSLSVDRLHGVIPQPVDSVKGCYRYFTHMDNPEKHQYDPYKIIHINGFNLRNFTEVTSAEKSQIKKELVDFIKDNDIFEYSDFVDLVMSSYNDNLDYFDIATGNTLFFNNYIKSRRYSEIEKNTKPIKVSWEEVSGVTDTSGAEDEDV